MKTSKQIILSSLAAMMILGTGLGATSLTEAIKTVDQTEIKYNEKSKEKAKIKNLTNKEEALLDSIEDEMNNLLKELSQLKSKNQILVKENRVIQNENMQLEGNNELLRTETEVKGKMINKLQTQNKRITGKLKGMRNRNGEIINELKEGRETTLDNLNKYIITREYDKASALFVSVREQMFLTPEQEDDYEKMIVLVKGFKKHMVILNSKIDFNFNNKDMLLLTLKRGLEYLTSTSNRMKLMEATWVSTVLSEDEKNRVLAAFEVKNNNLTRALFNAIKIKEKTAVDIESEKKLFVILEKIEKTQNGNSKGGEK